MMANYGSHLLLLMSEIRKKISTDNLHLCLSSLSKKEIPTAKQINYTKHDFKIISIGSLARLLIFR